MSKRHEEGHGKASLTIVPKGPPDHNGRVQITIHYRGADGFENSYDGYSGGLAYDKKRKITRAYPALEGLFSGRTWGVGDLSYMTEMSAAAREKGQPDVWGYPIGGAYFIHRDIGSKGCPAISEFAEMQRDFNTHGRPRSMHASRSYAGHSVSSDRGNGQHNDRDEEQPTRSGRGYERAERNSNRNHSTPYREAHSRWFEDQPQDHQRIEHHEKPTKRLFKNKGEDFHEQVRGVRRQDIRMDEDHAMKSPRGHVQPKEKRVSIDDWRPQ